MSGFSRDRFISGNGPGGLRKHGRTRFIVGAYMNTKILGAMGVLWMSAVSLLGDVRFVGVVDSQRTPLFALKSDDEADAKWVKMGQTYHGYVIQAYDSANQSLTLSGKGETLQVRLQDAKVIEKKTTLPGRLSMNDGQDLGAQNLRLRMEVQTKIPVRDGVELTIWPQLLADGNISYSVMLDKPGPGRLRLIIASEIHVQHPGEPVTLNAKGYQISFFPAVP